MFSIEYFLVHIKNFTDIFVIFYRDTIFFAFFKSIMYTCVRYVQDYDCTGFPNMIG